MEKPLHLDPATWAPLDRFAAEDHTTGGIVVRDAIAHDERRRT